MRRSFLWEKEHQIFNFPDVFHNQCGVSHIKHWPENLRDDELEWEANEDDPASSTGPLYRSPFNSKYFLSFGLRFPSLRKSSLHMWKNPNEFLAIFLDDIQAKCFLLNRAPGCSPRRKCVPSRPARITGVSKTQQLLFVIQLISIAYHCIIDESRAFYPDGTRRAGGVACCMYPANHIAKPEPRRADAAGVAALFTHFLQHFSSRPLTSKT